VRSDAAERDACGAEGRESLRRDHQLRLALGVGEKTHDVFGAGAATLATGSAAGIGRGSLEIEIRARMAHRV
jgi:hypothetical protein